MNESLRRVLHECQAIAARRHDVLCGVGKESIHVCRPAALCWIKVESQHEIIGTETIMVHEYRPGSYQQHTTCCAWEAATLVEQLLDMGKK